MRTAEEKEISVKRYLNGETLIKIASKMGTYDDVVTRKSFKEKEERYKVDNTFYEWAIVRKEDNQFMSEITKNGIW